MASSVDIYKSQDRPPPGVKRSSAAKTGSSCESLRHLGSAVTTGETTPLLWTIRSRRFFRSPLPSASPRLRERTPAWQVAHHRCALLLDSPLNESATAVGGRPVHGSRGNAENALVPTRRSFGGDPEKREMRIVVLVVFVIAVLAAVSAQDFRHFFAGFGPFGLQGSRSSVMRDPRSNRGPVLFPPGPPPNSADTSGVIVGASGYGFVPPSAGYITYFYY
ncbi:PREDICTED: uncharacterized protein LOC105559203 [Vollenhovia emeryi]|uniref:uncharacterized protein LOC105559203 n=1 Tax=Vollenhovia emeryi TaxID=411798 RepID=UPI0005F535D9|nr:PREDICTED: uncharacterized protein LOC105559203 [Vollenhovia emeryi]